MPQSFVRLALGLAFLLASAQAAAAAPPKASVDRVIDDIRVIAAKARPTGSEASAEIVAYLERALRDAGAEVELQKSWANTTFRGRTIAARVTNVVGRIRATRAVPSTERTAILLAAHHDSAPNSNGANDDASGVASLLEAARHLSSLRQRHNDVVFLLSDAEEVGLLGARAFANEHPWAKSVAVVINLEARGNRGPTVLFETGGAPLGLLRHLSAAGIAVQGDSVMSAMYAASPFKTDLTELASLGRAALNFAYMQDPRHYHRRDDNFASISRETVAVHASLAVALAWELSNVDLNRISWARSAYFNLPGLGFVQYPFAIARAVTLLAAVAVAVFMWLALRRGERRGGEALRSLGAFILSLLLAVALTLGVGGLLGRESCFPAGDARIHAIMIALGVASLLAHQQLLSWMRVSDDLRSVGPVLFFGLGAVLCGFAAPGIAHLFAWPGVAGALSLALLRHGEARRFRWWLSLSVVLVPIWALAPLSVRLFQAAGLTPPGLVGALPLLLLGLTASHAAPAWRNPAPRRSLVGVGAAAAAVGALLQLTDGSTRGSRLLAFVDQVETGRGYWITDESNRGSLIREYIPDSAPTRELTSLLPMRSADLRVSVSDARQRAEAAPELSRIVCSSERGQWRGLKVSASKVQQRILIELAGSPLPSQVTLAGKALTLAPADGRVILDLYGFSQLELCANTSGPMRVRVAFQSAGLPAPARPLVESAPPGVLLEPNHLMRELYTDTTLQVRSIEL